MVTICVDGENKTHKITDWTLWAGNDDREVMLVITEISMRISLGR